jgi:hypothetical protein
MEKHRMIINNPLHKCSMKFQPMYHDDTMGREERLFKKWMSTKLGIDTQKSGAGKLFYTKQKFNLKWIKNNFNIQIHTLL